VRALLLLPGVPLSPALLAVALLAGCHRDGSSGSSSGEARPGAPGLTAPSASVITLGVALGTCPDLAFCEAECDAGSADRCRRLAATYAMGKQVAKDETKATALYEQACALKDASACMFAGQMHEFARGVPRDTAKAVEFYQRSCDLAWAPGCYNLAIMYERGTGVPADRAKAADMYQIACTAGAQQACVKARQLHEAPVPFFLDGGLP
jgi:TPR repeat protein